MPSMYLHFYIFSHKVWEVRLEGADIMNNAAKDSSAMLYNHGEGPHKALLLVDSTN